MCSSFFRSGGAWCVVKLNYIKLSLLYCVLYIILLYKLYNIYILYHRRAECAERESREMIEVFDFVVLCVVVCHVPTTSRECINK